MDLGYDLSNSTDVEGVRLELKEKPSWKRIDTILLMSPNMARRLHR